MTVRVGNELGGGNPTAAKRAAYCSITISSESHFLYCRTVPHSIIILFFYVCLYTAVVAAFCGTVFLMFRNHIGRIFTTDQ